MNKGKQWKWSKKIRKELEKLKKPPLKINLIKKEGKNDGRDNEETSRDCDRSL